MDRDWEELDAECSQETEVLVVEYNATNMVGEKIKTWYTHVHFGDGVKGTTVFSNECDGSSRSPTYVTPGHLTPAECLEHEEFYLKNNTYVNEQIGK
jgi:hypothetical protein